MNIILKSTIWRAIVSVSLIFMVIIFHNICNVIHDSVQSVNITHQLGIMNTLFGFMFAAASILLWVPFIYNVTQRVSLDEAKRRAGIVD